MKINNLLESKSLKEDVASNFKKSLTTNRRNDMKINKLLESKKIDESREPKKGFYSEYNGCDIHYMGTGCWVATDDKGSNIGQAQSLPVIKDLIDEHNKSTGESDKNMNKPVVEAYGSEKHPEQDKMEKALMNIKGTTKVEFDYRPNDGVYKVPENHLIVLVFCRDDKIFGDGLDYFKNRKEWKQRVLTKLRNLGWVLEDPMEDNDTYLYLVLKKKLNSGTIKESAISSVEPAVKFKGKSSHTFTPDKKWEVDFDEEGNILARTRHGKSYYFSGHINDKTNEFGHTDEDAIIQAAREQHKLKFGKNDPIKENVELDSKYFKTLERDKEGNYLILNDGTLEKQIVADNDEDAIKKFKNYLNDKSKSIKESSEGFQKEFYKDYVILKNRAGDGWDVYSYDGTPEKVKRAYLEDEGYATLKDAKEAIDSWTNQSTNEGYELSPNIDYNPNHLRDDEGRIMADRWYASKWPDDEVGIEQLSGITLDGALKDRSILGHCDTQVRERVYAQLDKYIPLSVYSPMFKEPKSIKESVDTDSIEAIANANDSKVIYYNTWNELLKERDTLCTPHIRMLKGGSFVSVVYRQVASDICWPFDERAAGTLEKLFERYPRYKGLDVCVAKELLNDVDTEVEEPLSESIVSSSHNFDDDIDDLSYYYDDESWEEPGVDPRKDFDAEGREYTWVKRHGDVLHLDFDNWAVWEAYCHDDAESYYFIVDEDTGFIDWGPCDTQQEAQDFLDSKKFDWDSEYENEGLSNR